MSVSSAPRTLDIWFHSSEPKTRNKRKRMKIWKYCTIKTLSLQTTVDVQYCTLRECTVLYLQTWKTVHVLVHVYYRIYGHYGVNVRVMQESEKMLPARHYCTDVVEILYKIYYRNFYNHGGNTKNYKIISLVLSANEAICLFRNKLFRIILN